MKRGGSLLILALVIGIGWLAFAFTADMREENAFLKDENKTLREKILAYENAPEEKEGERFQELEAGVFSSYPTNERDLIILSAGRADGVATGMPVVTDGDVLVGRVIEVTKRKSVVQTVFDPKFSIAVFIGTSRENGLYVGGVSPKIELVNKDALIEIGDVIRSSDQGFPINLRIGEIVHIDENPAQAFREATVLPVLKINTLRRVSILIDFL